jgi:hypothetical protein
LVRPSRIAALALIVGFLATIFAVPLIQVALELVRHEGVQAADLFRRKPSESNLHQYEKTLQDRSWFRQAARPVAQRLLYETFGDPGPLVIRGRDGWVFYRPDVEYLAEGATAVSAESSKVQDSRQKVLQAILTFRDQLKERGIDLVMVPMPNKSSVYPEKLIGSQAVTSPTRQLIADLRAQGVATADLFARFEKTRAEDPPSDEALYWLHDTHWTPAGAELAADEVARVVRSTGWVPQTPHPFKTRTLTMRRYGDILAMMQLGDLRSGRYYPESVCHQVLDETYGPLMPSRSDRPGTYRHPSHAANILVLGDSFSRIYQATEPKAMGEIIDPDPLPPNSNVAGRSDNPYAPLPGSAGFISHLALDLQTPIDYIVSNGGASTDVRRKLSVYPEILAGKRLVIWEFAERDVLLTSGGWQAVPLPPKLNE